MVLINVLHLKSDQGRGTRQRLPRERLPSQSNIGTQSTLQLGSVISGMLSD